MKHNNSRQYTPEEHIVLTTLMYSDIFDFPLTKEELWKYAVGTLSQKTFNTVLKTLQLKKVISLKDPYYYLHGREANVIKRVSNIAEVDKKMLLAKKAAHILAYIPTIQFIGISGGLAVLNVSKEDDVDFFIIVKKNSLFVSRFWVLILLELMGIRRSRVGVKTSDMICVNLLLDETALSWFKDEQDLYIAHEIAQVVPLFERDAMYEKFLKKNGWVTKYLPHVFEENSQPIVSEQKKGKNLFTFLLGLSSAEVFFRFFQKILIRRNQTTEIVSNSKLGFHPNDYKTQTLSQLKLKMRQLGLLTNI